LEIDSLLEGGNVETAIKSSHQRAKIENENISKNSLYYKVFKTKSNTSEESIYVKNNFDINRIQTIDEFERNQIGFSFDSSLNIR
ncbi:hypothetical protein UDS23_10970, partial [Streptococcus salivarius]|uniref:hypothetical protein n=1 Tax=Streptococcus salivarius TaxID=1304 RepID=UPI002BD8067C